MAIRLDKATPQLIEKLPAKVEATFEGRVLLCPRAVFRNKKGSISCNLTIDHTVCSICAYLNADLGCHGGGIYYVEFWDNCHLCATVPIEFDDNCTMVSCEVSSADTQSKWPLWKNKNRAWGDTKVG